MKNLLLFVAIWFITLFMLPVRAQIESPPTLSLGLDGLIFKKGLLDYELIAAIIAGKQEELKKEFVKWAVLENLPMTSSFTCYNYASNATNLILNHKNKQVLTRELLEHTANLSLVYGFTEFYLQMGLRTQNPHLLNLITAYHAIRPLRDTALVHYIEKTRSNPSL